MDIHSVSNDVRKNLEKTLKDTFNVYSVFTVGDYMQLLYEQLLVKVPISEQEDTITVTNTHPEKYLQAEYDIISLKYRQGLSYLKNVERVIDAVSIGNKAEIDYAINLLGDKETADWPLSKWLKVGHDATEKCAGYAERMSAIRADIKEAIKRTEMGKEAIKKFAEGKYKLKFINFD